MHFRTITRLIILAALLVPSASGAGTRIECENWAYDQHGESGRLSIYIDGNRVRIDDGDEENSAIWIVDGDNSTMTTLDHKRLEFVVFTKDNTKKFYQKIEGAVEQVENFLPQIPKERREQVKKQTVPLYRLYNILNADREKDKNFKYEKSDEAETIMEVDCASFKAMFKGDHFQDVWLAPFDKLAASRDDVGALLTVPEGLRGLIAGNMPITSLRGDAGGGAMGMPMRVVVYDGDTKTMRTEILEIHSEDIDASRFEVPEIYDEVKFDEWLDKIGQ